MFATVCFLSQAAFENHFRPRKNTVALSITDLGVAPARVPLDIEFLLRVQFDDLSEESLNVRVGHLPDKPLADAKLMAYNCILPDGNHAKAIVAFLLPFAASQESFHLVVHCYAGISRSAAVAAVVADRFGAEIDQANPDTSCANPRLTRLLHKVLDGEPMSTGDMPAYPVSPPVQQQTSFGGIF